MVIVSNLQKSYKYCCVLFNIHKSLNVTKKRLFFIDLYYYMLYNYRKIFLNME